MNAELNSIKGKKVLVIGDVMLDTYHIGDVKRISPEAPVPVVRVTRTYNVLGGAANVARNLLGLGCSPYVVSLLGNDHNGNTMQEMFADLGIRNELFYTEHPTITKTRVIGNSQQVVRLDFETENECLNEEIEQKLLDAVKRALPEVDIVVISDYGKGVCNDTVCQQVISASAGQGKKVIIDPKGTNWEKYRSATIITPNLKELSAVSGVDVKNEDKEIHSAADRILKEYNLTSLLVTRSEKGMSYIAPDASQDIPTEAREVYDVSGAVSYTHLRAHETSAASQDIPTEAREVYDVSGAGDTVVATLAAALAAGIPIADAIYLANKAAGIVVGKIGTSPILFKELQDELQIGKPASKLIPISQLADTIKQLRAQERKIIFTNGCFDILHKGHVCYLEKAKRLGDVLIVGLNSDSSVKRLKGESRPINDESARSTVLAALEAVDYVVIFTEDTPLNLIKTVAPDVLVKGGDYAIENIVGREYAQETVTIPFVDGYSTTKTIGAINQEKQYSFQRLVGG